MAAIFFRSDAHIFFEHLGEVRATDEARLLADVLNWLRSFHKFALSLADSSLHHVLHWRQARVLFEAMRQVRLADFFST